MNQETQEEQAYCTEAMLILLKQHSDGIHRATRQHWLLNRSVAAIGRGEDNDVVIPDRWISRHHAEVRRERDRYVLYDLGSKNGTFLNDTAVTKPVPLENGDRIQLSPTYWLSFVDSEATAPLLQNQRGVRIDQDSRRVWVLGRELHPPLSRAQFALLCALVRSPGLVFSRDELRRIVWPDESPDGITDEAVNSLVRRLRRRLIAMEPGHRYIYAIRGHGFKFEQPE
jgi:DNA-binding response OmpR family regulator